MFLKPMFLPTDHGSFITQAWTWPSHPHPAVAVVAAPQGLWSPQCCCVGPALIGERKPQSKVPNNPGVSVETWQGDTSKGTALRPWEEGVWAAEQGKQVNKRGAQTVVAPVSFPPKYLWLWRREHALNTHRHRIYRTRATGNWLC